MSEKNYYITRAMPKSLRARIIVERVVDAIRSRRLPHTYRLETFVAYRANSTYLIIRWGAGAKRDSIYLGEVTLAAAALAYIQRYLCHAAQVDLERIIEQYGEADVTIDPRFLKAPLERIMENWEKAKKAQAKKTHKQQAKAEKKAQQRQQAKRACGVIAYSWDEFDKTLADMSDAEIAMMIEAQKAAPIKPR